MEGQSNQALTVQDEDNLLLHVSIKSSLTYCDWEGHIYIYIFQ